MMQDMAPHPKINNKKMGTLMLPSRKYRHQPTCNSGPPLNLDVCNLKTCLTTKKFTNRLLKQVNSNNKLI